MNELPNRQDFIHHLVDDTVRDTGLREKLLKNPKAVIESKINFKIPDEFEIIVHEDTAKKLNIVIPISEEELTEVELEAVSGAGCYTYCPSVMPMPSDNKLKANIADISSTLDKIKRIKF